MQPPGHRSRRRPDAVDRRQHASNFIPNCVPAFFSWSTDPMGGADVDLPCVKQLSQAQDHVDELMDMAPAEMK